MITTQKLLDRLRQDAFELGFDAFGVAPAKGDPKTARDLEQFVALGHHGTMSWMADTAMRRSSPLNLWPEAKSIIMLAMNYGPETDPLENLKNHDRGTVSVYARHRDYHNVIKGRLKTLASKLVSRSRALSVEADVKVFVDTAPVMEKPLAHQAGLGWQGKHTNLVSRQFGSWLFLGSIFTTLDLPMSTPESDHCGTCTNCLDICPTNAFPAPYQMDARRCISYLTIEHVGPIPEEFRKPMGNRIYGCDDCLAVCPWNKFAQQATEAKLAASEKNVGHALADYLRLDDPEFREEFAGSPIKRIGLNKFLRNCLIAAGNSKDPNLLPHTSNLENHEDAVVRDSAQWATQQLLGDDA